MWSNVNWNVGGGAAYAAGSSTTISSSRSAFARGNLSNGLAARFVDERSGRCAAWLEVGVGRAAAPDLLGVAVEKLWTSI